METPEQYNVRRAEARRSVLGRNADYNGMTPAQAFNAAWDMCNQPPASVNRKPNHYYHDSLGDPATCTEDHNHPEE